MRPASRSSDNLVCITVGEASSQAVRSARDVSDPSRNSHMIRNTQRRPSRSSSAMIGRPVREPRTAGFPGDGGLFRHRNPLLHHATNIVAYCYIYCSAGVSRVPARRRALRRCSRLIHRRFKNSSTASCAVRRRWCCFGSWRGTPAPGRNSAPAACWTADRCRCGSAARSSSTAPAHERVASTNGACMSRRLRRLRI